MPRSRPRFGGGPRSLSAADELRVHLGDDILAGLGALRKAVGQALE